MTTPPLTPAARPAPRVAVIGAGPRGVGFLERLAHNLPQFAVGPVIVHLIDPHPVGGGRIWRAQQSPLLKLNSLAQDVQLFTDDSVVMDGPVAPGPSLIEWAQGVRDGRIADAGIPADASDPLRAELDGLTGTSFPTRRLQSAYLDWFTRRAVEACGERARVVEHRDSAVGVDDLPGGGQRVRLAGGGIIDADVVLYALGHAGSATSAETTRLADFARDHGLHYVPPSFTADADLAAIAPGEPVIVRGLGLAAIDLLVLLAEGRGGRFVPDADAREPGRLRYLPSGAEPRIFIGSRRGIPYRSKVSTDLVGPRPEPRFFTTATAAALATRPALDFRRDVWPLIAKEMLYGYYAELFTGHPERVRIGWPEFLERFFLLDPFGADLMALAAETVVDPGDRLHLARLDRPLVGIRTTSLDELQAVIRAHIRDDVDRRTLPEHSATQGLFLALLNAVFTLGAISGTADWTDESRERDLEGWWHPYFSYLASGPPGHRLEELLALSRAGVVTFLGSDLELDADAGAGLFRARGANTAGATVEAHTLVDAWLPAAHAVLGDSAALRDLIDSGAGREQRWGGFASGRIEVTPDAGRIMRADGTAHPRRFALGPFTSSPAKGGFARPRTNAVGFRENDAAARAVLAELAAAGTAAAGGVGGAGSAPAIVIRRALPREFDAVGALCLDAYTADYPVSESYALTLRDTAARADEFEVWVAADHVTGELVGTVSILRPGLVREGRSHEGELYFRLLAVSPRARRRGIGAALTRFALDVARERGQRAVVLNSVDHMLAAHALYRSLGFERIVARDVRNPDNTVFTFAKAVSA